MSTENLDLAKRQYEAGKAAFERGQYRQSVDCLEQAVKLISRATRFGGEVQMWLVTAYQAAGQQQEAIALCETLEKHPDHNTRQQSRRLSYILKAPQLQPRPEWLTQIPDLTRLDDPTTASKGTSRTTVKSPPRPKPQPKPEPIDLSQVNTQDNGFVWVGLGAIALLLGGLIWLGLA